MATALSDSGEVERARDLGAQSLDALRRVIGPDHPHTLVCAANLALDTLTLGDRETAAMMHADVLERYRAILPDDHIDVLDTAKGERMTLDFEPPSL